MTQAAVRPPVSSRAAPLPHVRQAWWRWPGYAALFSFAAWLMLTPELPSDPLPDGSATLAARDTKSNPAPNASGVATRPIEQIRVGQRVWAMNPEVTSAERRHLPSPDWPTWIHLSLEMPLRTSDDQTTTDRSASTTEPLRIELLRPQSWVEDQLLLLPTASDEGSSSSAAPDVRVAVQLDLPELGAVGTATVTRLQPCPTIEPGDGEVVTGTFAHPPSNTVLNVWFEGEPQPLGVTANHLFWNVDRQQFVAIDQFAIGERVQTYFGETKRIEQTLPRPGPQTVHNLEVHAEHVYHVGQQGLLAHNAYAGGVRTISSQVPESYMNARHFVNMEPARNSPGSTLNSFGEVRNANWFWRQLLAQEPEMFSKGNIYRIQRLGLSPKVDSVWTNHNPTHQSFVGDTLHHHHVGQGSVAVPLPRTVHTKWTRDLHGKQ